MSGDIKKNHRDEVFGGVSRVDPSLKARGLGPRGALGPGLSLSTTKVTMFICSGNPPHSSV